MVKGKKQKAKAPAPGEILSFPTEPDLPTDESKDTVCTGPHPHPEAYYHWGLSHKLRSASNCSSITSLHNVRTQTPYGRAYTLSILFLLEFHEKPREGS